MQEINLGELRKMQDVDIKTIDSAALMDIKDVSVNTEQCIEERIKDFICQIKNPYCYKCGNITVKISFSDTDYTLEDRMKSYLLSF